MKKIRKNDKLKTRTDFGEVKQFDKKEADLGQPSLGKRTICNRHRT
jgi:hypothetical protein